MSTLTNRVLDILTRLVLVAVLAAAGYLGYQVWSSARSSEKTSLQNRAIDNLLLAVRNNPGDVNLRVQLGDALLYAGDTDGALEQYSAAVQIDPEAPRALSGLATIAMGRKDLKQAETYWTKVIDTLADDEMAEKDLRLEAAYYGLGVVYVDMKRWEDAVANLKEAVRIKDSNSDTHYMLSIAYRELGYPDKQQEELVITLAFDPEHAEANYDLGLLALKQGDEATAAEYFRISADNAPEGVDLPGEELRKIEKKGDAKSRLANARRLRESDTAVALSEARIAAALDPTNVEAARLAAELWEERGNPQEALKAYVRLSELLPHDELTAEAIKRLSADVNK